MIVAGQRILLRPSFENLIAAEAEVGSLFALVERASEGTITIAEITALLWHCIDGNSRPDRDTVGNAVIEKGLVEATKPVRTILAQVLQGRC
jgi:hypothetical protein